MKRFGSILVVLVLVLGGGLAWVDRASGDLINGDSLRLYCASQNAQDDAICLVYITGAFDAFTTSDLIAQKTSDASAQFCVPDGIGPEALKEVVVEYMSRPDTNLDFSATLVILGAIIEAYGCGQ